MTERKKRQSAERPTDGELRLLQILWDLGQGTVNDVVAAHVSRPNRKTTLSMLCILEQKRYVAHSFRKHELLFWPIITREAINHADIQALVEQVFRGSLAELILAVLESVPSTPQDIDRLEEYLILPGVRSRASEQ